jgi:hypothetical protein
MAPRALESEIDRLYQLPLDEFTSARNALAKTAGGDAARVRALVKPPVSAWAVNQLYWKKRNIWDSLIAASENARRAHKAVIAGRSGDVRAAGKVHDDAAEAAVKSTLALLEEENHPVTDATKQAITTTIRALPGSEPPGRLTKAVQPGGFEMLAGLSVAAGSPKAAKPAPARPAAASSGHTLPKADAKALVRAREALEAANGAVRDAEHAAKREEFEIAKATRDQDRAGKAVDDARAAVEQAQTDLERAEASVKTAAKQREAAEQRRRDAERALVDARRRAEAAARELKKVEKD